MGNEEQQAETRTVIGFTAKQIAECFENMQSNNGSSETVHPTLYDPVFFPFPFGLHSIAYWCTNNVNNEYKKMLNRN